MREKKNNLVHENGKVITPYRVYSEEAYNKFLKYKQNFDAKRYRRFIFRLVNGEDDDAIDFLQSQKGLTEYIKGLVMADMEKQIKAGAYVPPSKRPQPQETLEENSGGENSNQ